MKYLLNSYLTIILFLLTITLAHTQITVIQDNTLVTANNDGFISANEYVGFSTGINSDFGDLIGSGSKLYFDSDQGGNLNIGLEAGGACCWTDIIVIYFDSKQGQGFNSTLSISDGGDTHRTAISVTTGSEITFAPGFEADYALAIHSSFTGLFRLDGPGLTFLKSPTTNITAPSGDITFEISGLRMSDLGIDAGSSFDFVATLINPSNGYRSNEFHGVSGTTVPGTVGTSNLVLNTGDFNTFSSVPPIKILSMLPSQNDQGIAKDSNIVLTFDQSINGISIDSGTPNDVTDDNILVSGENTGLITGLWTGGGTSIISFNPDTDFKNGELVTVLIGANVQSSTSPDQLGSPIQYQFTVSSDPAPEVPAYFEEKVVTTLADRVTNVFAIDVDSDGDIDILSASQNDDKVSWYENDGNENFTEHPISTSADGATTLFASDIDKDGDIDVMSASILDDKIALYKNDGNENFTEFIVSNTSMGAIRLSVADVNGDGELDILSASQDDNTIAWHENDGNENFTKRIVSTTAMRALSVIGRDLDNDGDVDLISASQNDDKVAWYENDGNQNFTEKVISSTADGATTVFSADVDSDGDLDILSASVIDNKVAWYENDGNTNFTEKIISTSGQIATTVHAADIDGDGDIDVLSAASGDNMVAWYENDGNEIFTERVITMDAIGVQFVYVADVDLDGKLDVLSASWDDDKVAWYKNSDLLTLNTSSPSKNELNVDRTANLIFEFDQNINGNSLDGGTPNDFTDDNILIQGEQSGLMAGTITGNGTNSISFDPTADFGPGEVITVTLLPGLESQDGNNFPSPLVYQFTVAVEPAPESPPVFTERLISSSTDGAYWIGTADLDGDGDQDAISSDLRAKVAWYENTDGSGTFGEQRIIDEVTPSLDGISSIQTSDIDSDGDLDVIAGFVNDKLVWYENMDGAGNFGGQKLISTQSSGIRSIHAADLDGDGDHDVVLCSIWDDELAWYENTDGLGAFDANKNVVVSFASDADPQHVQAADIDGDGALDLIVALRHWNIVGWFRNYDGSGVFEWYRTIATNLVGPSSAYPADLDGDGDLDVVSSSISNNTVAWYENTDGIGTFSHVQSIASTALAARMVRAADVDGDGDLDVLSASENDDRITWYENTNGMGLFGQGNIISDQIDQAIFVNTSDIDGDGDLDVLSAAFGGDKVAWHENRNELPKKGFMGMTPGAVFTYDLDTKDLGSAHTFDGANGQVALGSLIEFNGKLWGMTSQGGINSEGVIFSINADGTGFIKHIDFGGDNGISPSGNLLASGGKLWGLAYRGGVHGFGTMFYIEADGSGFTKVHDFDGIGGQWPNGSLVERSGKLWGTTSFGGTSALGTVFNTNLDGSGFTKIHDFNGSNGQIPLGDLADVDGKLWGVTRDGGTSGSGTIFTLNPNGGGFTTVHSFDGSTNGLNPYGKLRYHNGKLWGITTRGGSSNNGIIFSINPDGGAFDRRHDFNGTDGSQPLGSLVAIDNRLWGMTWMGGANGAGVIFSIKNDATEFTVEKDFASPIGSPQFGSLLVVESKVMAAISFGLSNVTYGDAPFDLNATSNSTGTIAYDSSDPAVVSIAGSTATIEAAGDATITVSQAESEDYFATAVGQAISVNTAILTVTANDETITYGGNPSLGVSYNGFVYDDSELDINPPIVIASYTGVGMFPITLIGGSANNYSLQLVDGTLTVNKGLLMATADDKSILYSDSEPEYTISYSGFAEGEDATVIDTEPTGASLESILGDVGSYTIKVNQDGIDDNYDFTYLDGTLTVNKRVLTATADDKEITFGDSEPEYSISYSGFAGGEDLTVIDTEPSGASLESALGDAGSYTIKVNQDGIDNNYDFTYQDGTLIVNKADQTITFEPVPIDLNSESPDFDLEATASSGLEVSFSSGNTSIVTITGTTVSILDDGEVTITASQEGDINFNAAPDVGQTLTIDVILSIMEAEKFNAIYPNPAVSSFSIVQDSRIANIYLVSLAGKVVKTYDPSLENTYSLSNVTPGMYILFMELESGKHLVGKLQIGN